MMILNCVVPVGLPASGKSYLHKLLYSNMLRISADDIRFGILNYPESGIDYDESIEPTVWKIVWNKVDEAVKNKESFYFDTTNISLQRRKDLYSRLTNDYTVSVKVLKVSVVDCIIIDTQRKRTVGSEVIIKIDEMYDKPTLVELSKFDSSSIEYITPKWMEK